MNPRVQIVAVVGAVLLIVFVLELVRKRKLREEYSLLWLAAIACVGVLAFHRPAVESIATFLGVAYAPSAIFIVAFVAGFLLLLHFSIAISRLLERDKRLTQEVALLKDRIHELEFEDRRDMETKNET